MDFESFRNYPPGDPALVDKIVCQLKSQGIFDQFRKECISDVDTKPAYQNLRQRVDGSVAGFLANQEWKPDLNKNQLRESLRKHVQSGGFLEVGVERIVDQVVNPKICQVFLPQVKEVVYECLGIKPPKIIGETRGPPICPVLMSIPPPSIELRSSDVTVGNTTPIEQPSIADNSDIKDNSKNLSCDDVEEKIASSLFNPLDESDDSLDSHVSGITELASHSSLSLNVSKESNELDDKDIVENNDSVHEESLIKSEDSNVDSILEAPVLLQSDTNTNISAFDLDSIADVNDHIKSDYDESTQTGKDTPVIDNIVYSDDDISVLNPVRKVKDELLADVSDFSKNDSDDYSLSNDDFNSSKNDSWRKKHKYKSEKSDDRKIEHKKDDTRKRYHSEHKNERQTIPVDQVERSSLIVENETCESKCNDEKLIDKIHKSSDDEKERKEIKKEIKVFDKSKNRDKFSKNDGIGKVHHSKENYHHHHHSSKEKYAKDFSREDSRDSKDSSSSNNIDKKSDKNKSRDRIRDHKRTSTLEESNKFKESRKEKERNKSESSDGKNRDSVRSGHHSDSKSRSRSESDSRDKHHHHHHHYHHSKEEKQEDSKEKTRGSSKEDKKEAREHRKESFRAESSQSSREGKDVKRKEDCHKSKSREEKSDHHRRDRHDSSVKNKERRHHEHAKSDKTITEPRKDEKKSAYKSHNNDKEKIPSKHASEVNKHRSDEKTYEKHNDKHKKDERSRSKKGREQCKSSSKEKEDRRSTDRDSSGSGERGGGLSHVSHSVNARQREIKDKGNISNKNVSETSASDSTEVSVGGKETCLSDTISGLHIVNEGLIPGELRDGASQLVLDNTSNDCSEIHLNEGVVYGNISDKNSSSAGDELDSLMVGDTDNCIFNSCRTEVCESKKRVKDTSVNKIEPNNVTVDSTEVLLKDLENDESINCSVAVDIKLVDNSSNCTTENVVNDFVIDSSDLVRGQIAIQREVDKTENIAVGTIQCITEVSVGNVENDFTNEHFCNFSTPQSTNEEVIEKRHSEIIPFTIHDLKNSIAAKLKQKITNLFVHKKIMFIKKNIKKIQLHRLQMQNVFGENEGFYYFKLNEIEKAKENMNDFNSFFKKIKYIYDIDKNEVKEDFVKTPVTISLKKYTPGGVESRASIYKINLNNDSSKNRSLDKILLNTDVSSDLNHVGVVKAAADEHEKRVKNKNYLTSEDLSVSQLDEENGLLPNDVKRSPVKLRISVKNPYDCKIIEVEDSIIKENNNIRNNFSNAIPSVIQKKEVSVAPSISDDSQFIEESVGEVQWKKQSVAFSKENECNNTILNLDTINSFNKLKRKRGRPKKNVGSYSVQPASRATEQVLGHGCRQSIVETKTVTNPIINSQDLKLTNSIVQKVNAPQITVYQAVSPKSPPESTDGGYIQSCLGDAAISFDDVTRCCVLSRTDKSNSYKTSFCDPDYKNKSSDQYVCTSPVDGSRSLSASKNVDIISPNRLNNNLSDTSDCADEGQLNEGESYLTNSIIGEALKDLMQESGLIGGYPKAGADNSNVATLKTEKQRKQSTKKGRNLQENRNVTSSKVSGRISGSSKHMQRYDNSDLYKPRLAFRQNKRNRSPVMSLRGSGVNKAETSYSSSGAGPPSKRAR